MEPNEVRSLFPIMERRTYLFSGGHSPMSSLAREAVDQLAEEWSFSIADRYARLDEHLLAARGLFAGLIGADLDEVAVVDSTGAGSNLAVEMTELGDGGNVVFDEWSYPSSIFPWMLPARAGIERRFVSARDGVVEVEDLAEAIDDDTIAVSISHVTQGEGFKQDLAAVSEVAHSHGALLLVDGAQSAGAMSIDVHEMGIDFLSAGACKWLLGPAGVAYFYGSQHLLERMPPHAGGPSSVRAPGSHPSDGFTPKPGAARFQLGIPNILGLAAAIPGLEILTGVGKERVESHVLDLSGYCIDGLADRGYEVLTPADPNRRGGVVAVVMDDAPGVERFMADQGIDVYSGHTHNRTLRVDPHIFNNRQDIDTFLYKLDEFPT